MEHVEKNSEEMLAFLEKYAAFLEDAVLAEAEKQTALKSNKLPEIERTLARQQAVVMEMGNLEKQRMSLQARTGFGELTVSQIAASLEGEERQRCEKLKERMEEAVSQIKKSNLESMQIAREKIELVSRITPQAGQSVNSYSPYGKKNMETTGGSVFESKI